MDFFVVLIPIIILFISLLNVFVGKKANKRKQQPAYPNPDQDAYEYEEETYHPVQPAPVSPVQQSQRQPLRPDRPLREMRPQRVQPRRPICAEPPRMEVKRNGANGMRPGTSETGCKHPLIADPKAIRDAFVLSEILKRKF